MNWRDLFVEHPARLFDGMLVAFWTYFARTFVSSCSSLRSSYAPGCFARTICASLDPVAGTREKMSFSSASVGGASAQASGRLLDR
jgi:hypothetical protein